MKKIYFLLFAVTVSLFTSCKREESKVRAFVDDFANKVIENDVRSLHKMILGVEECEDFALENYSASNVVIEKQDDGYHVNFSDDRFIIVNKDAKGKFTVESTYGIVVFDPDLYDFAVRTGWISKYMDDATVASLLSDYEFRDFMIDRITEDLRTKITVSGGHAGGASMKNIIVNVNNDTDYNIPAEAYKVLYSVSYWAFPEDNETITFEGVDLPAHGTKTISGHKRAEGLATDTHIRLQWDEDCLPNLCMIVYKANGHEYKDWKKGKLK